MSTPPSNDAPRATGPDPAFIVSSSSTQPSLTAKVIRGAAWNTVGTGVQRVLTFSAAIIVARLLLPSDYAVAGMAGSVIGIFSTLATQGFAFALIQQQELTDISCHSVFWFMTFTGLVLSGLTIASIPWLAQFYRQPALVPVMVVLAFGLWIGMVGAVPNALLQRAMRFRQINLISIVGGVLSAVLGIGVAWSGYGYWALIMPGVGSALFTAVFAFWLSGYRPAPAFQWKVIKSISGFGFSMVGASLVNYFAENSDYLIMGRFWSPADFGQYYFAFEKSRQPYYLLMTQLANAVFPAFSRIQDDIDRLRRAFLRGTHLVCLVVFPLHVLIIGLANPLVTWVFGEQWRPAVPAFQLFAGLAFVRGLASLVGDAFLALNRAQALLAFNVFRVIVILPALLFLGINRANIIQVSVVLVVIWVLQAPVFIGYLYKQIRLSWKETWGTLRSVILATTCMGCALALSRVAMLQRPAWMAVIVSTLLSSAVYVWLARRPLREALQQVRAALGGG